MLSLMLLMSIITARFIVSPGLPQTLAACPPAPTDMVSWWKGDGNANDSSDGNSGTLTNGATFTMGQIGQAFSLDGVNDYITIPDANNLTPPSNNITLSAWVNPTSLSGGGDIVTKYSSATGRSWLIEYEADGSIYFAVHQNASGTLSQSALTSPGIISTGVWTHIVGVYDVNAQTIKIYKNGIQQTASINGTGISSIFDSTTPVNIGSIFFGGIQTGFLNGLIDDVRLYDRPLTSTEVLNIYNEGVGTICPIPTFTGTNTLSSFIANASNVQNTLSFTPVTPIPNGGKATITFPADYSTSFASLLASDISVSATNLISTAKSFDTTHNRLTLTFTTSAPLSTLITVTIGDGVAGGLHDLSNPPIAGSYDIGIDTYEGSNLLLDQGSSYANIMNAVSINAIVSEALIMTIHNNTVAFEIDPSVNNGEDKSQYTLLTAASNALNGYHIYGSLDDGTGTARLTNGTSYITSGTGENNFGFEAKNATYSSGESVIPDASFSNSATMLASNSTNIGLTHPTNAQQHTIYYDLNVDYTTPAGSYSGVITYTAIGSF